MATARTNFFYRIGAKVRRGLNTAKRFEARVTYNFRVRFPAFGGVLAHGLFLLAKLAVVGLIVLMALAAFWLAMIVVAATLVGFGLLSYKQEEAEEKEYYGVTDKERKSENFDYI